MPKLLLTLVALYSLSAFAGGDLIVGNGGEVIKRGSRIELREFYDLERIDFGRDIKTELVDVFRSSKLSRLPMTEMGRELLLTKLTDLQSLEPNLGMILLEGSRFYEWLFVDEVLKPFDDPMVVQLPADTYRLTAANRLLNTIRIQRQLWAKMDDVTRVGLIIHELVYSFITIQCGSAGAAVSCAQSPAFTREIVAKAFSDSGGPDYRLTPTQRAKLSGLTRLNSWNGRARLRLQMFRPSAGDRGAPERLTSESTTLAFNPSVRARTIANFCSQLYAKSTIEISADLPSVYVTDYRYPVGNNLDQVGLCLVARGIFPNVPHARLETGSRDECVTLLSDYLDQFYMPPPAQSCGQIGF